VKGVGNSANAAVSAARLGLSSFFVGDIGKDQNGKDCLQSLKENHVSTKYVSVHKGMETNYHYVLWYEADRTILVKQQEYPYKLPQIAQPKWIYLSSLAANSFPYHLEIIAYLKAHPETKLAFQPGTFQMKLGNDESRDLYQLSEVFICNLEESQRILKTEEKDIKKLLALMHAKGPKIVLITDGPNGAYMNDGKDMYFMPIYPDPKPPLQRTGCGDAFASTFVSALIMFKTPLEALMWAPINPMSVVQHVGAQKGLLNREQLEELLKNAPADYHPKKI
jgi:sugar/nucleoside kinase (ribokinase family)